MKLLVISLTFIWSLILGDTIQAQERRISVVNVECKGSCAGSTLGQLCRDLADPTFRPFAVDCGNVIDIDGGRGCGDNNECFPRIMDPQDELSAYCGDTGGNDAHVYCEQVTTQEGTFGFGPAKHPGVNVLTVSFPLEFTSIPQVQVTPRGGDFPDVFAVTTRNVNRTSFEVVVYRIDLLGDGWNQHLRIDWHASSSATGGVVQPVPCTTGWDAIVQCTSDDPNIPPKFDNCPADQNPTFDDCKRCVASLIGACMGIAFESTLCACGPNF
jgi:hypothetical protein